MSRVQGFEVMDMSTSLLHDPKIRRLSREHADVLAPGFMAYVATVAESWKAGDRLSIEDAWPSYLPYDGAAIAALTAVGLLDDAGRVPVKAWRGWFAPARKRRESSRKRYSDWKARHSGQQANPNGNTNGELTVDQPLANGLQTGIRPSVRQKNKKTSSPTAQSKKNRPATSGRTNYDAAMVSDDDLPNAWTDASHDSDQSGRSQ